MTNQEYKAIVKIHGKNFSFLEIPTFIRQRDHYTEASFDQYQKWCGREEKLTSRL